MGNRRIKVTKIWNDSFGDTFVNYVRYEDGLPMWQDTMVSIRLSTGEHLPYEVR